MGDLLKTTVSSQLFTVSGSPRTRLTQEDDGQYVVHMEGVDIYDTVTNAVRSTGAEKVAAWFLDSDYDGRCFCVCQAFFPDKGTWEKLGKALGAHLMKRPSRSSPARSPCPSRRASTSGSPSKSLTRGEMKSCGCTVWGCMIQNNVRAIIKNRHTSVGRYPVF